MEGLTESRCPSARIAGPADSASTARSEALLIRTTCSVQESNDMTDTAVATQQQAPAKAPILVLREKLEVRRNELEAALPDDISSKQFIRAVMTAASLNPDILTCNFNSIWLSCMKACRDGLLPDGVEGALVPYKGVCNWIAMYQGKLRQFRRSGKFRWIAADLVHEGEHFEYFIDENGVHFKHVPGDNFLAPMTKVYAMATTKDGGVFVAVLTRAEADKHRAMSKTQRDDAPWKQWPEEMYKKTALIRLSKLLPSGRDLMGDDDDLNEHSEQVGAALRDYDNAPLAQPRPQGVAAALDQFAGKEPAQQEPTDDPYKLAYEAGKKARADGVQRRAMPGEFRDPAHEPEAVAWLAGWDG